MALINIYKDERGLYYFLPVPPDAARPFALTEARKDKNGIYHAVAKDENIPEGWERVFSQI